MPIMENWLNESWPLLYLLPVTRQQLADCLDVTTATGLGYQRFAAELRIRGLIIYTAQDIELFRARSQPGSVTLAILLDYDARGGTVQGVQQALVIIGHRAAQIIPEYLGSLYRSQAGQYDGYNQEEGRRFDSQYQNTEPISCNCPRCQVNLPYSDPSNSPNLERRERSIPNGSISTWAPRARRRRSEETGRIPQGSLVQSSASESIPSAISGSGERLSYVNSEAANSEPNAPVSAPLQQTFERSNTPNLQAREIQGEINNSCSCEECRLNTDPEQTKRLTYESEPKVPCMLVNRRRNVDYWLLDNNSVHNAARISEDLSFSISQLYLDSEASSETSTENVEVSDETYVKSVFRDSESINNEENRLSQEGVPSVTNNKRPICSKSDIGKHRLGEMVDKCKVCRNNAGAIPKTGPRSRNNSDPQKNEASEHELRKSWHGTPGTGTSKEMMKSLSDSKLLKSKSSSADIHPSCNRIDETIYSRISSINSGNSIGSGGGRGDDSTSLEINSYHDVYKNNLESDNDYAYGLDQMQALTRNIVQSDSSNFSLAKNEGAVNNNISSSWANVEPPQNDINSNNKAGRSATNTHQRGGSYFNAKPRVAPFADTHQSIGSAPNTQQMFESPTRAQQRDGSATSAQQRDGCATNAQFQQRNASYLSAQQSSGSATVAQERGWYATSAQQSGRFATRAQQENWTAASARQNSMSIGQSIGTQRYPEDRGSRKVVFITYSWNGVADPESFIQEIITMSRALREAGILVKIDMDAASYATLMFNRLDWIDRNVREANYVIVCISPTYAEDIEPNQRIQARARDSQLNARYIFDKLREEYYSNSSQNKRIIPVMFTNYGTTMEHVPQCMRSTLVYRYPNSVDHIIAAVLGHGRYRPS